MKTLLLLRHAKSGWDTGAARDFDRVLNAKGRRAAQAVGRHLRRTDTPFDRIVASDAARVVQTIESLGVGYGRRLEPEWDRRLYLADAESIAALVREQPDEVRHLLVVSHNPGLEDLVLLLAPPEPGAPGDLRGAVEEKYPTASLAEIAFDGDWADVGAGRGRLVRFVRPRDLDPALGPDEGSDG